MNDDLEIIRKDLNLVTLAESAGANLNFMHGEWRGACPIHRGEGKQNFAIYEKQGRLFWRCFSRDCNERGGGADEFAFLVALTGQSFAQVVKDLREKRQPITTTPREPTPQEIERRLADLERQVKEQEKRLSEIEKWKERQPWQQYHDHAPAWAASEWERAGIPESWQSFWRLGGCESFTYSTDGGLYTSPTLTIPVYAPKYETCATVRHRLLRPADPSDKYRPDMAGLGSHPFLADPDLGIDAARRTIVVEGEKKAMVTFLTLDLPMVQVIGLPGKSIWRDVAAKLRGQDVIIALDPDANQQAEQMAREVGGARVVQFGRKLDDTIIQYGLDDQWLIGLFKTARYVV